jgi:hypothetical protein
MEIRLMSDENKSKFTTCEVGLFRLPGIVFEKGAVTEEEYQSMVAWAAENNCGKPMTETLWSFKSAALRDWFILRWS